MIKLKAFIAMMLFTVSTAMHADPQTLGNFTDSMFIGGSLDSNFFSSPQTETAANVTIKPTESSVTNGGYSLMAGKKWDRLGAQLGYSFFRNATLYPSSSTAAIFSNAPLKRHNVFIDALLFYPINETIDLKAALGLGLMHSEIKGNYTVLFGPSGSFSMSRDQLSPRLGLGLEWQLFKCWSMDAMLRYQKANFLFDTDIIFSLGFYYHI